MFGSRNNRSISRQNGCSFILAITCAGESIGTSIDYWPRLKIKKDASQALKEKGE